MSESTRLDPGSNPSDPSTATMPSPETAPPAPGLTEAGEAPSITPPREAIAPDGPRFDPSRFSTERLADQLMDDLFGEIEQSLEPGGRLLMEPMHPPVQERSPEPVAPLAVASMLEASPSNASLTPLPSQTDDLDTFFGESETTLAPTAPDAAPEAPPHRSLDKLLMAIAIASLLMAGGVWLVLRIMGWPVGAGGLLSTGSVEPSPPQTSPGQTGNPGDTEFLSYLDKSLDAIANRAKQTSTVASADDEALPPVPVAGSIPSAVPPSGEPYIRVYAPPASIDPTTGTVAGVPGAVPNVAVVPPVLTPAAPLVPQPASTPATAPTVPNIAPASNPHLLVGLLEQGDRSVALFEANNTIQRVSIGESIGSSGWTLVSVSDSEAIVRRNGEVRSIYVGQQF